MGTVWEVGRWGTVDRVDDTHHRDHSKVDHIHPHSAHRSRRDRGHTDRMARRDRTGRPRWGMAVGGRTVVQWL